MLQFEHTEFLWGLAVIPVLVAIFLGVKSWKRKTMNRIGEPRLIKQLTRGYSRILFSLKYIMVSLAVVACVLAAATLRKPLEGEKVVRKGTDVMIVLDVSKSMQASDIQPTRLERAKLLVNKLIDQLPDERVGLILFAGRAYMQMPVTSDLAAARMYVNSVSTQSAPTQGTVIAEALRMAGAAFNVQEKKYKTVVLITDGEDHDPNAVKMAESMAENGVIIHTVGIGSPEGAPVPDEYTGQPKRDKEGNIVISKLNEPLLKQIAASGKGIFERLASTELTVRALTSQIESVGERVVEDSSSVTYRHYFFWFVSLALGLIIAEFFMPERKKLKPVL
ncbi:MAG TPA: VWA domain-containing protein [Parasegetibacter sp.]